MKKFYNIFVFTVLLAALQACAPSKTEDTSTAQAPAEFQFDHRFDDSARLLAGMELRPESEMAVWQKNAIWVRHAQTLNKNWETLEQQRLSRMRKWALDELHIADEPSRRVFYPFSGPDFLHVNTFFPKARSYIMIGLENPGTIPDYSKLDSGMLQTMTIQIEAAIQDIFRRSYFITMSMSSDLSRSRLDGTAPVLFLFLARTHNTIVDAQYTEFSADGSVMDRRPDSKERPTGLHIKFMDPVDRIVRDLYYFKFDLSDENISKKPGFVKFIESQNCAISYVKSASYLMHYQNFSRVRDLIFNHSEFHLQDDTGIAYKFFDKNKWQLQLYGEYEHPIRDFSGVYEADLNQAYRQGPVKPVPFQLGYHWYTQRNNLMLAIRKNNPGSPDTPAPR